MKSYGCGDGEDDGRGRSAQEDAGQEGPSAVGRDYHLWVSN